MKVPQPKIVANDEEPSRTGAVLQRNLIALMEAHAELNSAPKLAKKTKLGTAAISRLRNNVGNATLRTLDALANAFDLEPWQLLVPNLEPRNHPVIQMATQKEREIYERLRTVAKEMVDIEEPKR